MQNAEIKKIIESSFKPYHCGVKFLPARETLKKSLGLRVSDEDGNVIYQAKSELKAGREDLDQHIEWWRKEVAKKGFKLVPLC